MVSAEREARMAEFIREAIAADADIERSGEAYSADDVHAWMDRLARGEPAALPQPIAR